MSTDRPDKTESPFTVDAGHLQIESDLATFSWTDIGNCHQREGVVLGMNCKIGLTDRIDLQVVIPTFTGESDWIDGDTTYGGRSKFPSLRAFGSVMIRCKVNIRDNDSSGPAIALMPYCEFGIKDQNRSDYAAGIILPMAVSLTETYSLSSMVVVDETKVADQKTQAMQLSASLGHDLSASWGGYVELFSEFRQGIKPSVTFDTGLTLGVSSNMQFDFGINLGLTETAADYNPFLGLSIRI
ncbi:MAG: transporter [bacterium]|nr:transporter [bacterium]